MTTSMYQGLQRNNSSQNGSSSQFCRCHGVYERSCPSLSIPRAVALGMRDEFAFQQKKGFFDRLIDKKIDELYTIIETNFRKEFENIKTDISNLSSQVELLLSTMKKRDAVEDNAENVNDRLKNTEAWLVEMGNRLKVNTLENAKLRASLENYVRLDGMATHQPNPPKYDPKYDPTKYDVSHTDGSLRGLDAAKYAVSHAEGSQYSQRAYLQAAHCDGSLQGGKYRENNHEQCTPAGSRRYREHVPRTVDRGHLVQTQGQGDLKQWAGGVVQHNTDTTNSIPPQFLDLVDNKMAAQSNWLQHMGQEFEDQQKWVNKAEDEELEKLLSKVNFYQKATEIC